LQSNSHLEAVETKKDFLKESLKKVFWDEIDIEKIEKIQKELSSIIKYKKPNEKDIVISDLKDEVIERRWINYAD